MSPNRRIIYNIAATYGRSVVALICGLFTARWVLMALGQVDYGLFGLVGGLTAFVVFFNNLLSSAVGRFYAVSIGAANVDQDKGLSECRNWFSTAVCVHTILPSILVVIGYPVGCWAIKEFLTIPIERVGACVWVWRFACVGCYVAMLNVPFNAMYRAKQEIAELTIYSLISTVGYFCFVWYMVEHPGDWLVRYAAGSCLLAILPQMAICVRAFVAFKECRITRSGLFSLSRLRRIVSFAGWQLIGASGSLLKWQGVSILINKYFGARVNAAMTIGTSISSHCNSLSASIQGAFSPAIMNAYGEGDVERARKLAYSACKFETFCVLVFAVPLIIEINEVLTIWLKTPPNFASGLAVCILIDMIIDRTSSGHMILVNANGNIAMYQAFLGGSILLTLPLAWLFVVLDFGVYSIGCAMILTKTFCAWGRVWFARGLVGMSARYWIRTILFPVFIVCFFSSLAGFIPQVIMTESGFRVICTTLFAEAGLFLVGWRFLLDDQERDYVAARACTLIARIKDKR